MAGEVTIPNLPCADIDVSIDFYEALGFICTYRQMRPNPFAVVSRDDFHVHLFGIGGFVPEDSYGSVVVVVPDPDGLYADFAAGLRARFGKLPSAGIPRILRPRRKHGVTYGFSVVDPGGNWLRISGGHVEKATATTGLARVLENAARLGDSKGDTAAAVALLDSGLQRFSDAPAFDRASAFVYRAELAVRMGDRGAGQAAVAAAREAVVDDGDAETIGEEIAHAAELVDEIPA